MPDPTTKTFDDLVEGQATTIQAEAAGLADLSIGSLARAIIEAFAGVVLWLQGLILKLLSSTRAATSTGTDLDTWMADYGLTRLAADAASGTVTFSRRSTSGQAVVPTGTTVETFDGAQAYTVTVDLLNPAYNAGLGGYVMANTVGTVNVPVVASVAGAAGNAASGAVTIIASAAPGIDAVTNASAFTGGADAESDADLRIRFVAFLASLTKATPAAVIFAVESLSADAQAKVIENQTYAGSPQNGFFAVIVDDGSGIPGSPFLTSATNAIEAVRPLTSTFAVYAPVVVTANVTLNVTVASGYVSATVKAAVETAIAAFINALGLDGDLAYTRLIQVAYDASAGVASVAALLVNAGTSDVTATVKQRILAGTVTATVI